MISMESYQDKETKNNNDEKSNTLLCKSKNVGLLYNYNEQSHNQTVSNVVFLSPLRTRNRMERRKRSSVSYSSLSHFKSMHKQWLVILLCAYYFLSLPFSTLLPWISMYKTTTKDCSNLDIYGDGDGKEAHDRCRCIDRRTRIGERKGGRRISLFVEALNYYKGCNRYEELYWLDLVGPSSRKAKDDQNNHNNHNKEQNNNNNVALKDLLFIVVDDLDSFQYYENTELRFPNNWFMKLQDNVEAILIAPDHNHLRNTNLDLIAYYDSLGLETKDRQLIEDSNYSKTNNGRQQRTKDPLMERVSQNKELLNIYNTKSLTSSYPTNINRKDEKTHTIDNRMFIYISKGTFVPSSSREFLALYSYGQPLNENILLNPSHPQEAEDWFWSKRKVDLTVINNMVQPVEMYWENLEKEEETFVMSLGSGVEEEMGTFQSHVFVFRDAQTKEFLARKVITSNYPIYTSLLIEQEPLDLCNLDNDKNDGTTSSYCDEYIPNTEFFQTNEHDAQIWRGRGLANRQRLVQNEEQPEIIPYFTDRGFQKIKLPKNTWNAIQKFYKEGLHQEQIKEPWSEDDTHVNFWESHTTMLYISEPLRALIFDTMEPILRDWSNQSIPLSPTSTYGIRTYHEDSWLREHVDIGETHLISAIINVAQQLPEDILLAGEDGQDAETIRQEYNWPLNILDHNGNRHWISMEPGDAVLYESAKCIHGRMQPLKAAKYANIFTHFKPRKWKKPPLKRKRFE